jgi:hypothetical protein
LQLPLESPQVRLVSNTAKDKRVLALLHEDDNAMTRGGFGRSLDASALPKVSFLP